MCSLTAPEQLPENTMIYGEDVSKVIHFSEAYVTSFLLTLFFLVFYLQCQRRIASERPMPQSLQLDFLSKILPSYHHLLLASKPSATPNKR